MISTVKKKTGTASANAQILTTRQKIELLKQAQLHIFNQLKLSNPCYQPKNFFIDKGVEGIGLFEGELKKGVDIYTERVSKDYLSIEKRDPKNPKANQYGIVQTPYQEAPMEERQLYVWRYRKNWEEIYHTHSVVATTNQRILFIPVSHLVPVNFVDEKQQELELDVELKSDNKKIEDIPITEMTVRDYAAIIWRKPVSNKNWINELIKSLKQ